MDRDKTTSSNERASQYSIALAYLRAFLIVFVVAHHAAQGYNVILPPADASSLTEHLGSMRAISPVIDEQRSDLLSLFAAFNDSFFMSLLFLLSGLFFWSSLQSKGSAMFLRDRLLRLGVPLAAMTILRPLTYYPTYLQTGGGVGLADFWRQWSAIEWGDGTAVGICWGTYRQRRLRRRSRALPLSCVHNAEKKSTRLDQPRGQAHRLKG